METLHGLSPLLGGEPECDQARSEERMADADWDSPMKSARSHGPDTVRRLAGCPPGTCWS